MKTLIVYYSLEGTTRFVADVLRKEMGADIFELKVRNAKKRTGFLKYFIGGMQASMGFKPLLEALPDDLGKYDLVILGSPVWASSPAPAMNSFLARVAGAGLSGRKVAVFCCAGGDDPGRFFEKMATSLKDCRLAGTMFFQQPSGPDRDGLLKQAVAWAGKIRG